MSGSGEHGISSANFPQIADFQHRNLMRHTCDDREIMGDENKAGPPHILQAQQQVQDTRLNRNVQRRRDFITDQQVGFRRQRSSNCDPLLLSSRKLQCTTVSCTGSTA